MDEKMTLCMNCMHNEVCAIRDTMDDDDERALSFCYHRKEFANRWISVEERLPEPNVLVLVVFKRHDEIRRRGFGTIQQHGVWYVSNEGMPPVTHWMYLPEPPTEEDA